MVGVRSIVGSAVLAALAAAGPAPAKNYNDTTDTVAGWDLKSTGKTCTMASTFGDNVSIALVWAPSAGELGFMAALPRPDALDTLKSAPLELTFDGNGPYKSWEQATAPVTTGVDNVAVIGNWGKEHADDLAKSVAAATHVRIRIGDREIGSYDLSGNQAAYRALMRCGEKIALR